MALCRHPDIQKFDDLRCCLSCGEAVFEAADETEQDWTHPSNSEARAYYQYKRLNYKLGQEIRLLKLYAGDGPDSISCSIIHVNLNDRPAFEAISYTWASADGDASRSQHVRCKGQTIAITKTCEAALRRLRKRGSSRLLWIDAICIDQSNTAEKNHQVKLMASIYSSAVQVLAFLAPYSAAVDAATERVMDYLQCPEVTTGDTLSASMENDVKMFLRQPYFDRLWVLQEVGLARSAFLISMNRLVQWNDDSIQKMRHLCLGVKLAPPCILSWPPAQQSNGQSLLDALHRSRNCSGTDVRDKVYGVLGLAYRGDVPEAFPLDYSLEVAQVYASTAIYLIETHGFGVFKHASVQTSRPLGSAPSWAPQWDIRDFYKPLPAQLTHTQIKAVSASWHYPTDVREFWECWTQYGPDLAIVAEIEKKCRKNNSGRSTIQWKNHLQVWFSLQGSSQWSPSVEGIEALSYCVVQKANQNFYIAVRERPSTTILGFSIPYLTLRGHRLDKIIEVDSGILDPSDILEQSGPLPAFDGCDPCEKCLTTNGYANNESPRFRPNMKFVKRMKGSARELQDAAFLEVVPNHDLSMRILRTTQSMGFAREGFRVGDTIWVLGEADVPFILRKVADHYILVGECYLHRATQHHFCPVCEQETLPWPIVTEIIDVW